MSFLSFQSNINVLSYLHRVSTVQMRTTPPLVQQEGNWFVLICFGNKNYGGGVLWGYRFVSDDINEAFCDDSWFSVTGFLTVPLTGIKRSKFHYFRAVARFFVKWGHSRERGRHEPCKGVWGYSPSENCQIWRLRNAIFSTCHKICLRKIDIEWVWKGRCFQCLQHYFRGPVKLKHTVYPSTSTLSISQYCMKFG